MDQPGLPWWSCCCGEFSFFREELPLPGHKQKAGSVKTRRGHRGKHKVENKLRIVGVNANGLSSKLQSLDHIIKSLNPAVICIQETKLRKIGKIKGENTKNYVVFEITRKQSHGGGLATLVRPDHDPVFISEDDDQVRDFALFCEIPLPFCERMIIDEEMKHPLISSSPYIIINFNIKYKKQQKDSDY